MNACPLTPRVMSSGSVSQNNVLPRRKAISNRRDRIIPDWLGWLAVVVALALGAIVAWLKLG
jgi:hypothetical protein